MKKSTIVVMVAFVLLSIVVVYVLSGMASRSHTGNGFTRKFARQKILAPVDTLDLQYDSYYIAGNTDHQLYLGNIVAPRHLLIVSSSLDTQHLELSLNIPEGQTFYQVRVKVDSPFFYMTDGSVPAIFRGQLLTRKADPINTSPFFLDIEPISAKSFAVRSLDGNREAVLGKFTVEPVTVDFRRDILQKQIDGVFCTEGTLHYNKASGKLVYVYLYRNQYTVMDTALCVLYSGNTIDTTTIADIKVATVTSNGSRTLSAPPHEVNKEGVIFDDRLFIYAGLQADNETYSEFNKNSVIDIYDLTSKRYIRSFYIAEHRDNKLRSFRIVGGSLYALYEQHLVSYNLNEKSPIRSGEVKDTLHARVKGW